ncbi:MAG TPA: ATP-binding cassette domain-containing protein [Gammaproteobacteria bacterium]|nr:ATP-binding cassette domain-containing protein [Gammaproteobacteria bacterium]
MNEIVLRSTGLCRAERGSPPEINLSLERNTLACLVGPSDSGKTLCLRLLGGLDSPDSGNLEILGRDLWRLDEASRRRLRRRIGYVLPNSALLSSADVMQNLILPADYHHIDSAEGIERRARQLLEWLGYPSAYNSRPVAELPPCHQRMVAIARCLMLDPEILFVDDAFVLCDPELRSRLAGRYLDMKNRLNMTLVLATDDMEFARRFADVLLYILPQGLRVHDNRTGPDEFLHLLNREGVDDYTRAIEG